MSARYDVVIPYKRARSEELVYALRSLKNLDYNQVYIVGDNPATLIDAKLSVNHIPSHRTGDPAESTFRALTLIANTDYISEDFIWSADDIYIMEEVKTIPVLHRGYYDDIIAGYGKNIYKYYVQRMIKTNEKLKSMGIEKPICYEMHIPFVINKTKWNGLLEKGVTSEFNKLLVYGNIYRLGGEKSDDVKVRSSDWIPPGAFASSHESTFRTNSLGREVRHRFAEKGEYEK